MDIIAGVTFLYFIMIVAVLLSFCAGLLIGYLCGKRDRKTHSAEQQEQKA